MSSLKGAGGRASPRSPALRRTSTTAPDSSKTVTGAKSSLPPPAEEPLPPSLTPASVAREYFEKELEIHDSGYGVSGNPQTVVILQDDCYGHRYSRPRTSRANLGTIVERPERLHASILGLATAYVRLGGRHAEGHAAPHPKSDPATPTTIPFGLCKTTRRLSLTSPAATAIHGSRWMRELNAMCDAAESRLALTGRELTRVSSTEQADANHNSNKPKLHEGDLYLCSGSLDALEGSLGAVCEGVDAIFGEGGAKRAFVCIRPPGHHCSANMPSGFCWLNNVHVGIGHAALAHGLTHAAIIDFDLHHGDGSQSITWSHNARMASLPRNTPLPKKTAIGYFSLHDINSYPCEMGDEDKVRNASLCIENAHGQSIWNVHLQPWKTDAEFWGLYEARYSIVLAKARSFLKNHADRLRQAPTHPKPKAAIFISAGFDASEWESSGMQRHQVNVPTSFYARFTQDIVTMAQEEDLGVNGRVVSVLEGGYSDIALVSGVLSHISGLTAPTSSQPEKINGIGHEVEQKLGRLDTNGKSIQGRNGASKEITEAVDPDWWSLPHLEAIERKVNPPAPIAATKKRRNDVRPTYTSATQSYTAKIVSPSQGRRSFSGSSANPYQTPSLVNNAPSPPPPAVDWVTAAYELSKLLIPSDRETRSCKPEDLNAEASRAPRDHYSNAELPFDRAISDPKRMKLRDRKGKPVLSVSDDEEEKLSSRGARRKTIADVSLLQDGNDPSSALPIEKGAQQVPRHKSRRSSVASSSGSMHVERGSDFGLGSATGARLRKTSLTVKKPRALAHPRQEAAGPKAGRKQKSGTRLPATQQAVISSEEQSAPVSTGSGTSKAPVPVSEELTNDVDQLSSGVQTMRIKLDVPPKQEHEGKESKSKPESRRRPPKSVATKATKVTSPLEAKVKAVKGAPIPESLPGQRPVVGQPPLAPHTPPSETRLQPAAQPPQDDNLASSITVSEILNASDASNVVEASTPESNPPSHQLPQHQPLPSQQSPTVPRPATPVTAKRTKQDLPVFTSTSAISFGRSNVDPPSIDEGTGDNRSLISDSKTTDLESTLASSVENEAATGPDASSGRVASDSNDAHLASKVVKKDDTLPISIWDIPNTPQTRRL